jgi:hypothetical protein
LLPELLCNGTANLEYFYVKELARERGVLQQTFAAMSEDRFGATNIITNQPNIIITSNSHGEEEQEER